jgi:hypothetical protein
MTTNDACRVCNKVHGVDGWDPQHQPVFGDDPTGALPKKQTKNTPGVAAAISPWPFDPVLRQALIDKGVLTPQDLRDAEEKIRAVTSATMGAPRGAD